MNKDFMIKKCNICGKEIRSLNKNQLDFNFYSHIGSCKSKRKMIKNGRQ